MKGKNYEITAQNIRNHEIIGLDIEVVESSDPGRKNIKGKVIDETKNTLIVKIGEDTKVLPKKECVFEFDIGEKVRIIGKEIMKKPEDRVKE